MLHPGGGGARVRGTRPPVPSGAARWTPTSLPIFQAQRARLLRGVQPGGAPRTQLRPPISPIPPSPSLQPSADSRPSGPRAHSLAARDASLPPALARPAPAAAAPFVSRTGMSRSHGPPPPPPFSPHHRGRARPLPTNPRRPPRPRPRRPRLRSRSAFLAPPPGFPPPVPHPRSPAGALCPQRPGPPLSEPRVPGPQACVWPCSPGARPRAQRSIPAPRPLPGAAPPPEGRRPPCRAFEGDLDGARTRGVSGPAFQLVWLRPPRPWCRLPRRGPAPRPRPARPPRPPCSRRGGRGTPQTASPPGQGGAWFRGALGTGAPEAAHASGAGGAAFPGAQVWGRGGVGGGTRRPGLGKTWELTSPEKFQTRPRRQQHMPTLGAGDHLPDPPKQRKPLRPGGGGLPEATGQSDLRIQSCPRPTSLSLSLLSSLREAGRGGTQLLPPPHRARQPGRGQVRGRPRGPPPKRSFWVPGVQSPDSGDTPADAAASARLLPQEKKCRKEKKSLY